MHIISIFLSLCFSFLIGSKNISEEDAIQAVKAQEITQNPDNSFTYTINTDSSLIEWMGKKVLGQHKGTVSIRKGNLSVKENRITGGEIIIDM